jgi:hypothetical protein
MPLLQLNVAGFQAYPPPKLLPGASAYPEEAVLKYRSVVLNLWKFVDFRPKHVCVKDDFRCTLLSRQSAQYNEKQCDSARFGSISIDF